MSMQFAVLDTASEFLMDVAKAVSSSPPPLNRDDLARCFNKSKNMFLILSLKLYNWD